MKTNPAPLSVRITEIIKKDDQRATSQEVQRAKLREVQDMLRRGMCRVILKEELPNRANALTARFFLASRKHAMSLKDTATGLSVTLSTGHRQFKLITLVS